MHHLDVPQLLGLLVVVFATAKVLGALAVFVGQPAVLGELIAGVLLGPSLLALVDPHDPIFHLFSELGVVILLFEIGLETDLRRLIRVGPASLAVAAVGVVLPFALGYGTCRLLGLSELVAVVAGAALTATSVGITARVLSDLGRLDEPESRIILGAAVIDDVVGLVILAVVSGLAAGGEVTPAGVALKAGAAFGFLFVTLLVGNFVVPPAAAKLRKLDLPGTPTLLAIVLAFGLAWLAAQSGSAVIVGAFAAGLLLHRSPQAREIEHGIAGLGHFFVPLFFVVVGAAVDVRVFNPLVPENRPTLMVGGLLIVVAILGKLAAGYAPFWFRGKKSVIGVGMVPRGEVGLIFAQMGLAAGVFDAGLYGAMTLMVLVTTFIAPPALKYLFPPEPGDRAPPRHREDWESLVTEA
jgi:Kef-type K+ transport system membrane component KefB